MMKVKFFIPVLIVVVLAFLVSLLPDDEITISKEYIHTSKESRMTLEDFQDINTDIVMLIEFKEDELIRSIPITFTKNDPLYYFRKSIYKEYDSLGTAFLDAKSPLGSQNMIINAHSSLKSDYQFTFLKNYKNKEYFDSHPDFLLIDENGTYKCTVISFAEYDLNDTNTYIGWYVSSWKTKKDMENMIKLTAPYVFHKREHELEDKKLITLVTCNMEKENSRYVLQALISEH